jgi:hypothetical protein
MSDTYVQSVDTICVDVVVVLGSAQTSDARVQLMRDEKRTFLVPRSL